MTQQTEPTLNVDKCIEWLDDQRHIAKHFREAAIAHLKQCKEIREFVAAQANDSGLWFDAEYASEEYLQQELRKLHALIEEMP